MLSVIEKDKNLKVFREIKIVDDEFFIEEEKMSKDDGALIGIFIHKRAK